MDVGEFNGRRFYTGLRLWAATSASRAISAVAKLLVSFWCHYTYLLMRYASFWMSVKYSRTVPYCIVNVKPWERQNF